MADAPKGRDVGPERMQAMKEKARSEQAARTVAQRSRGDKLHSTATPSALPSGGGGNSSEEDEDVAMDAVLAAARDEDPPIYGYLLGGLLSSAPTVKLLISSTLSRRERRSLIFRMGCGLATLAGHHLRCSWRDVMRERVQQNTRKWRASSFLRADTTQGLWMGQVMFTAGLTGWLGSAWVEERRVFKRLQSQGKSTRFSMAVLLGMGVVVLVQGTSLANTMYHGPPTHSPTYKQSYLEEQVD
eukprot:TRINITY_DN1442_c0_g2_i1.p1 TRINITY_DN1442_c0_g2~~TRINITY_DN1442_c0_g2_i1.p1  ORF type:complete len:261 (+),score=94.27 TRINITY_DN1442_c0_g2_i1:55-783(+)